VFEGQSDAVATESLKKQLTFDQAASADDVEAHQSAKALAAYLQGRGFFDARVTWTRERFEPFDRIVFRIDQGVPRQVSSIEIVGNYAIEDAALLDVIGTHEARFSSSLFGSRTYATSERLAADVEAGHSPYRLLEVRRAPVDAHRLFVAAGSDGRWRQVVTRLIIVSPTADAVDRFGG